MQPAVDCLAENSPKPLGGDGFVTAQAQGDHAGVPMPDRRSQRMVGHLHRERAGMLEHEPGADAEVGLPACEALEDGGDRHVPTVVEAHGVHHGRERHLGVADPLGRLVGTELVGDAGEVLFVLEAATDGHAIVHELLEVGEGVGLAAQAWR